VETGELCDDGNRVAADGCAASCLSIDAGYACATNAAARSVCTSCVVLVGPGGVTESGQRWAEAYTDLSRAIAQARTLVDSNVCARVSLWVTSGRYSPIASAGQEPKDRSFRVDRALQLLGGFAGNEWAASARDWQARRTVLTGDNAGDDASASLSDNAGSVVLVTGKGATLDGFSVTAGHGGYEGGGLAIYAEAVTLRNLVIEGNTATRGGGVAYGAPQLLLDHVQLLDNSAEYGGGMFDTSDASALPVVPAAVTLDDVVFRNNIANVGGAIFANRQALRLEGASFEGNEADRGGAIRFSRGGSGLNRAIFKNNRARHGGAIAFSSVASGEEFFELSNSLFSGNSASEAGGALHFSGYGSAEVKSSTFSANSAPDKKGGAAFSQSFTKYELGIPQEQSGRVLFHNSILWGNSGGEALGRGISFYSVNCVQGFTASASFVACQVGTTPFLAPSSGNYRLHAQSAAIDHGSDAAVGSQATDLDGLARIAGAQVDLGCYETH
jgi:cysteine-rich repeat protein